MSFKLTAQAIELKLGNPLRKMVLIQLADQANNEGICWSSYEYIAKVCEMSRRTVITHIQWLEEHGFLRIEKRYNEKESKNFSNKYHLTLCKGKQVINNDSTICTSETISLGGANAALGGANNSPSNGANAAPKSISKPINESINESGEKTRTPEKPKKFIKPNFEQVRDYYLEQKQPNAEEQAHRFIDYYDSNGWKVSKNPMKDWKATVRNWIRRDNPSNQNFNQSQGQSHANHQPNHSQATVKSSAELMAERNQADYNAWVERLARQNSESSANSNGFGFIHDVETVVPVENEKTRGLESAHRPSVVSGVN